jgi:peptidoglycan/xylan/chitin deacetylase (PgdA/CDA1 family)
MRYAIVIALSLLAISAGAQTRTVALTFDDLPLADAGAGPNESPVQRLAEAGAVNHALLHALKKHHAPAIAFVNEQKIGDSKVYREILSEWIRNGQDLGNHTFSHIDLTKAPVEDFEKEVIDGEASIRSLMSAAGKPLRYLRFPFNHTGDTAEKRAAIAAFLKQHGYEVATCTIDTSDFIFARAYGLMLDKKDKAAARRLRADYLDFTREEIEYYTSLHRQIFGREIPHVMLLHANRLNADTIESILALFEQKKYRFVTLAEAQSDKAYQTPDTYVTVHGPMWGYRWARDLNIKVDGRLEKDPPVWVTEYK